MSPESRRVQTTLPRMRRRKVDPGSPDRDDGISPDGAAPETDRDLGLDMQNIEKPNSLNQSLNSASHVP